VTTPLQRTYYPANSLVQRAILSNTAPLSVDRRTAFAYRITAQRSGEAALLEPRNSARHLLYVPLKGVLRWLKIGLLWEC
jgi:hypothetical protein